MSFTLLKPRKKLKKELIIPVVDFVLKRPVTSGLIVVAGNILYSLYSLNVLKQSPNKIVEEIAKISTPFYNQRPDVGLLGPACAIYSLGLGAIVMGGIGLLSSLRERLLGKYELTKLDDNTERGKKILRTRARISELETRVEAQGLKKQKKNILKNISDYFEAAEFSGHKTHVSSYDYDEVLLCDLERVSRYPTHFLLRFELAESYCNVGRIERAILEYKNVMTLAGIGPDLSICGKTDQAAIVPEEAIKLALAFNPFIFIYDLIYSAAIRADPDNVALRMKRALLPLAKLQFSEAVARWEKDVLNFEKNPHLLESTILLANLKAAIGDAAAEQAQWQDVVDLVNTQLKEKFRRIGDYSVYALTGSELLESTLIFKEHKNIRVLREEALLTNYAWNIFEREKKENKHFNTIAEKHKIVTPIPEVKRFGENYCIITFHTKGETLRNHIEETEDLEMLKNAVRFTAQIHSLVELQELKQAQTYFDYGRKSIQEQTQDLEIRLKSAAFKVSSDKIEQYKIVADGLLRALHPILVRVSKVPAAYLVPDLDAHRDNFIVDSARNLIKIDFRNRGLTLPQFDLSKLIEYGEGITRNSAGDKLRQELLLEYIDESIKLTGSNRYNDFEEFNYFKLISDPLRAVSMHCFNLVSKPELVKDSTRYLLNAIYSLEKAERDYRSIVPEDIEYFPFLRSRILKLAQLTSGEPDLII